MKTWEQFFPFILQYVGGCPESTVITALKQAVDEFCSKSYILKEEIRDKIIDKEIQDYEIPIPSGKRLQTLRNVSVSGIALNCINTIGYKHPYINKEKGRPESYQIIEDRLVRFYPIPDKEYKYNGTIILSYNLSSLGVEDFIFDSYYQDIAYGAISLLTQVPGTEASNPEMSVFYRQKFEIAIDRARRRNYESVPLSVRQNPWR